MRKVSRKFTKKGASRVEPSPSLSEAAEPGWHPQSVLSWRATPCDRADRQYIFWRCTSCFAACTHGRNGRLPVLLGRTTLYADRRDFEGVPGGVDSGVFDRVGFVRSAGLWRQLGAWRYGRFGSRKPISPGQEGDGGVEGSHVEGSGPP